MCFPISFRSKKYNSLLMTKDGGGDDGNGYGDGKQIVLIEGI